MEINKKDFKLTDWQSYEQQLEQTLKVSKMQVLSTIKTLEWVRKEIKKFPGKEKKKNSMVN